MSGITVLSPLGINQVGSQPLAPRLRVARRRHPGHPQQQQAELARAPAPRGRAARPRASTSRRVVTKQKPSAAVGADGLDAYAKEVGAVITAIGD